MKSVKNSLLATESLSHYFTGISHVSCCIFMFVVVPIFSSLNILFLKAFFILLVSSAGTLLDPSGLYDDDVSSPESLQK